MQPFKPAEPTPTCCTFICANDSRRFIPERIGRHGLTAHSGQMQQLGCLAGGLSAFAKAIWRCRTTQEPRSERLGLPSLRTGGSKRRHSSSDWHHHLVSVATYRHSRWKRLACLMVLCHSDRRTGTRTPGRELTSSPPHACRVWPWPLRLASLRNRRSDLNSSCYSSCLPAPPLLSATQWCEGRHMRRRNAEELYLSNVRASGCRRSALIRLQACIDCRSVKDGAAGVIGMWSRVMDQKSCGGEPERGVGEPGWMGQGLSACLEVLG
jgi:hypothetical protein